VAAPPFQMADMARGKESLSPKSVGKITSPPYAYEHRISLDANDLDKLGIGQANSVPQVGDKYHVMGHGEVTNVSQNSDAEGNKSTRVELQLKKLGMRKKGGLNSAKDAVESGIAEAND
jgi:hypothetical protein